MSAQGSAEEFIDELVKVHLKQLDPQATDDIETSRAMGTTEIIFLGVVLAIVCFIVADFAYPYLFPKKKKKFMPTPKKKR
mmetsp:Transcript_25722/g.50376  ORF Transcript_25722/g.50376 Transcript_25722/m.50376 type:complete len:80 (-) Transcript_25722:196-435(-)|eukprot:CAMPEP_0172720860 /NCGR_PEP_ID=MMETSP1074-20121228/77840_1 /TAXON_ID=2916 /ORGANISM="Ceratium fusus, Strain PA161109" /LENGTH=79 /DNA_ID=CAMNT_0013546467 /DNA_START=108 /DNA_END=347 /DNA_ORIENTATION=+